MEYALGTRWTIASKDPAPRRRGYAGTSVRQTHTSRVSGGELSTQPDDHARRFHTKILSPAKPASRPKASMPYFQARIRGMLFLMASKGISFSMPQRAIR